MRKIAVSDIHGCLKTFKALVEEQVVLNPQDELYLLGDFIDRGPDSKGVLDYVMQLDEAGYQVHCLRGNHEDMMLQAVRDREDIGMWLFNGGQQALDSFRTEDPGQIPVKYLNLLDNFEYYFEVDNYILVHAGLNFVGNQNGKSEDGFLWRMHNPLNDFKSMLWIRYWYEDINWNWLKDRIIVHGHTPIDTDEIWDMVDVLAEDQVLDIDNGCYSRNKEGLGSLCAFDLSHRELYFQENIE
ncbi:MAG: metallophosphoesterase family protein [Bacteroidota bacterium]